MHFDFYVIETRTASPCNIKYGDACCDQLPGGTGIEPESHLLGYNGNSAPSAYLFYLGKHSPPVGVTRRLKHFLHWVHM